MEDKKRIIIKIGSSLLVENGQLRKDWLCGIAEDVLQLRKQGKEVIIVSSGSIALGRGKIKVKNFKLRLEEKQAAAAIGQISLMSYYQFCFNELNLDVAQILITADDANDVNRCFNSTNTINTLLRNNIIPIVNENDTVSTEEIKIGDNDQLAAKILEISKADLLILLSDVDGLYDKNPHIYEDARFISKVNKIDKEIETMAGDSVSSVGTGGMATKIKAAKIVCDLGGDVIIANGLKLSPIGRIINGERFTVLRKN